MLNSTHTKAEAEKIGDKRWKSVVQINEQCLIWTQSLILWKIMTFEKIQKYVFVHK